MRAYFFGNMYLSSIQQGIQALHVTSNMFTKYDPDLNEEYSALTAWANYYKTVILLNGGYSENIRELCTFLDDVENPYPWDMFNEGEDALDGALTCAGIVLPEEIYETSALLRSDRDGSLLKMLQATNSLEVSDDETVFFSEWEIELMLCLNTFGLAK